MIKALTTMWRIPDLRNKIIFTMAMLLVYRFGTFVPLPGVDINALAESLKSFGEGTGEAAVAGLVSLFSGQAINRGSIFSLGIMPYISASIIMQILTFTTPSLKALQEEGPAGQNKIKLYTKYMTVGICIVQSFMFLKLLSQINLGSENPILLHEASIWWKAQTVVAWTAGTMFLVWIGDQISYRGIGNGASIIIMAGIIVALPAALLTLFNSPSIVAMEKLMILLVYFLMIVGIVFITIAQRRIPIQMAKHVRGMRSSLGEKQYLPLKVNQAGVMPVIFAAVVMQFIGILSKFLGLETNGVFGPIFAQLTPGFNFLFVVAEIAMIIFFSYFWTSMQFNPVEMADQLKKAGNFVPGIRPGKHTAEFLEKVMTRVVLAGAVFLAIIDIIPHLATGATNLSYVVTQFMGGTGLLIVVGVALDLMQKLETEMTMRNYDGFATKKRRRRRAS